MALHFISNDNLYKSPEFKAYEANMRQLLKQEVEQIQKIYRLVIKDLNEQIDSLDSEKWRKWWKGERVSELDAKIQSLKHQIMIKEAERELKIIEAKQRCEERIWITLTKNY